MEAKGGGPLVEGGFWMNMIKTHCYATFASEEAAARAREELWGLRWPDERGGLLKAEFADTTAMAVRLFRFMCPLSVHLIFLSSL